MKQQQVAQHRCGSVSLRGGRRKRGLAGLLAGVSASAAALALSFAPQQARAQAVNGTPTVVFGANAPTRSETVDSFSVVASEALIDWAVTDPAVFLNANTTLAFNGSEGPYTVLNRVVSSPSLASTLALNGRIQSDTQGKIWFYNPGGWAVGGGAVIDVGSLLLTASPVTVDPFDPGNPGAPRFLGDNGEIRLGQTTVAGASISINPLASVSANGGDASYVALVAPRVVQAGTVSSDGSVAYVGAEAADITINNGLFDIAVTAGTTDPNGVVHTGTTTGASSFGSTPRTQFLVAVGKNDAMTMLVRGQLGYDAASSAGFVNGRIVLSSGQGIAKNNPAAMGSKLAGISLSAATLRNDLTATASDRIAVSVPSPSQSVLVIGNATLAAKNTIDVSVSSNDSEFAVQGDLSLAAQNGADGGAVTIGLAGGGALLVDGDFFASADGFGAQLFDLESGELVPGAIGEAARGGSVAVSATNATLQVGGATQLSADARGGIGGASAGSSNAGTVSLIASGSTVQLGEVGVTLLARGLNGNGSGRIFLAGTTGSVSRGGSATLDLSGGSSLGRISLDNSAFATSGTDDAAQSASTGNLSVRLASGTFTGTDILMNSDMNAMSGGSASGGSIDLAVVGASVALVGGVALTGRVTGDIPTTPGGAGSASLTVTNGGSLATTEVFVERLAIGTVGGKTATGGDISLEVRDGGSLASVEELFLRSEGQGAIGTLGTGGTGIGGTIAIGVDNGTLSAGTSLSAISEGLAGGRSDGIATTETGRGGTITLTVGGGSSAIAAPTVELTAPGSPFSSEGSFGGTTGIGGSVAVTVNGGTLTSDAVSLSAEGRGGDGALIGEQQTPTAGGIGRGGSVALTVNGGVVQAAAVGLDANGEGGFGASSFSAAAPAGRGGDAFGGSATLALSGGTLATDDLSITAGANVPEVFDFGEGSIFVNYYGAGGYAFGDGGVAGAGGTGTGGTTSVTIDGGALTSRSGSGGSGASPLSVTLDASGYGGNGGSTGGRTTVGAVKGDGGLGVGGSSTVEFLGGSADFLNLLAVATGVGGIAGFEPVFNEASARAPLPTGTSLGADGGDGRGGTATIRIAADLDAFNANGDRRFVIADATGIGGDAADGDMAGNGGNGFGGNATLEIDGATVSLIDPAVDATGSGGFGGLSRLSNPGGNGGAGFGGAAALRLANAASFNLTGGTLSAGGFGTSGRTGADGGGQAMPGAGGNGGDARGGTASLLASGGSDLTLLSSENGTLAFEVTGVAGSGGLGGGAIGSEAFNEASVFGNGGAGGSGMGGGIVIEASETSLDLGEGNFSANGFGGDGGGRVTFEGPASEFSAGGEGGEGFGGTVRLTATGDGAALRFSSLDIAANGVAGNGADGQGIDLTTFVGAPGGNGLAGTGGAILLEALSGGALIVETNDSGARPGRVTLDASGFAGIGGEGANGATDPVTGVGGAGGAGGNSGQGNGGSIALVANGGAISLGELQTGANGVGRFGAFGGLGGAGIVPPNSPPMTPAAPSGANGAFGIGGGGVGGSVELSALTDEGGAVGGLSLGDTTIDVTGRMESTDFTVPSVGGTVSIIDRVDDSNGGVRFGSLGIDASGDVTFSPFSVTIESSDGPIVVDNDVSIAAAGDVLIPTTGTGGLDIGGFFQIDTFGTVQIDDDFCGESGCPAEPAISADSSISISASGGNVLLIGAPTLVSGGDIVIDAGGSITGGPGSGYRTPRSLSLTAGGDIAVRNAEVGTLNARAGRSLVFVPETESFEEQYSARDLTFGEDGGGGRIVVTSELSGLAGGNVTIASGAEISTGFGLSLLTGDDIVIGGGASLTANTTGSAEPGVLSLDAGGLATETAPVAGDVASLIAGSGAAIDGGSGTVQLIGGAIDARGASISGVDVFADVRDPPAPQATQANDKGQLVAPCLEGDICLGSVTATGQVSVGQGDEAPVRFLGTGDIAGGNVAIRSRETLTFGSATVPLTTLAGGAVSLESQNGDVALVGGATLSGATVDVSAGGSLTGNGALVSSGDVGITVGDSVSASSIVAGGQLTAFGQTGGEIEGLFSVPGDFTVATLQLGADAAIAAGGDIVVGSASLGGSDVDFDAGGLVALGTTTQVGDIALSGDSAAFGALLAGGAIAVDATNAVTGTSATAGGALSINGASIAATTLRSGGAMALASTGATTLGSATSGAGLTIAAGAFDFDRLTSVGATAIVASSVAGGDIDVGTSLSVAADGDIALNDATAGAALTFDGAGIFANSLDSGGDTTLTADTVDVASIVSGGAIDVSGETVALGSTQSAGLTKVGAGTLTLSSANANGGLELTVEGSATLGSATSGAQVSILSGDLTFNALSSTGATSIDAASVAGGDIDAGTSLAVAADGDIALNDATAGAALTIDGAGIFANSLDSGGDTTLTADTVDVASIVSGGGIDVAGGTVGIGSTQSAGLTKVGAGTLTLSSANANGGLELAVEGSASLGSATSGAQISILSGGLTFNALSSTGATSIDAASVAGGDIDAGTSLAVTAGGAIGLGTATAGTTLVLNGPTISATRLQSGQSMALATTGATTLGSATSGAGLTIAAGAFDFDRLTSVGATAIVASSVAGGDIDAGTSLSVAADGDIALNDATAGAALTFDGAGIFANSLDSGGDTTLTADTVDVASIVSGGGIDVAGGTVGIGSTQSAGLTKVGAGTLTLSSANANGGLELTVEGSATLGSATSGAQVSILSGDLTFNALSSTGATSIDAASVAGGDIDAGTSLAITAGGAIGLGTATAGTTLTLDGASIAAGPLDSGGDTTLTAGPIEVGSIVSGGAIDVAGGTVGLGSTQSAGLTKVGAGTLTLSSANANGGLELGVEGQATLDTVQSGAGVTAIAGNLRFSAITASGDIAARSATIGGGDATSTTGAVALNSTGASTVGQLRAATDVTVTASALTFAGIDALRDITLNVGALNGTAIAAGRDLTIRSASSLTFGTIGAGRNVSLTSTGGGLTVTTDLNAGGMATLSADAIAVRAVGDLRVNSASADNGNISIVTDGLLRVDSARAIGDITLTSSANSLIVGGAVAGDAPNVGTALTAETTTNPGSIGAGAIALSAASDITMLGTVDANTALAATAGRLIDQRALAVGRTVAYRSADIALAQGASLGQSGFTTGITLTNTATGTGSTGAILGDVAGTTAGYRLDNAEFARIHSGGDLSLAAGSSLMVGALSASAASGSGGVANGNIGATSALSLSTSGELGVSSAFALANAGGNTLNLTSGGALFVDAGSGSVQLLEGSTSGGTLAVSAGNVMALTPAARSAVSGLDTRTLDQRLSMNDGVTANRTLLEAGAITLSSGGAILIQNTAPGISFDERRGFVADSLTLITRGETTGSPTSGTGGLADIVINGTVAGTTGLTALRAVEIDGSFTEDSTINGCRIVSASCGNPAIDPIRDLIEEEVEVGSTLENTADGFGQSPLITIDRIEPAGFETVIDEPVTGAGNDDFLVPEAGAGDEVCTEEDQTKCDKPPVG